MERDNKGRFIKQSLEEKFWNKVNRENEDGCWEWQGGIHKNGYGYLKEYDSDNKYLKSHLAHRLSYLFYNGNLTQNKVICHKCDNRKCVNPKHLFEGTQQENIDDMMRKGRHAPPEATAHKGSKNGSSKLTEIEVLEIRNKYLPRVYTSKRIAEEYGVSVALVEKIIGRKVWKHI